MSDQEPQYLLDAAKDYIAHGIAPIPVPYRSKNPGFDDWQHLIVTADEAHRHFNGAKGNIGVLVGDPSSGLIDIDLDHEAAVRLAPDYLPGTPAVFGRAGKPRSHWLYRTSGNLTTKRIRSRKHGTLLELRSTGAQTVVPPSVHETGEPIVWDGPDVAPRVVDAEELQSAFDRLTAAVKAELGETSKAPRQVKPPKPKPEPTESVSRPDGEAQLRPADAEDRCLKAMLRINTVDKNDGSYRLYMVACRAVEHDLTDLEALNTIRLYERQKPFPRDYSDADIIRRLRDAEGACERGSTWKGELDEEGLIQLGTRDPLTGRLVLSPRRTLPSAQSFLTEFYEHPDRRRLISFAGSLWHWQNNRYVEVEDGALQQRILPWLHDALRYTRLQNGDIQLVSFEANPGAVKNVLESIRSQVHLPAITLQPSWLDSTADRPTATEVLAGLTKLLHLPSGQWLTPTPNLFTSSALNYDPDPDAPEPTGWFEFLHQVLGDDVEAWDLLQQWFGYCLTPDTSQQKMLLVVGPRRGGKGTITRVLQKVIGQANVCGPTTSSLAGQFGLQQLLGRTLAVVSDARFKGECMSAVVERLLCISGEDAISVDRKHIASVTLKLPVRFMFLSNELPAFEDSSAALAGRFLVLRLTKSFYGHEDHHLTSKLLAETPGILNWAIQGWHRLREQGYFRQPSSSEDAMRELEDLASPVGAFVRDRCVVGAGHRVWVDDLYAHWAKWCRDEGLGHRLSKQQFGKDLGSAVPGIKVRRHRANGRFYDGLAPTDATTVPAVDD